MILSGIEFSPKKVFFTSDTHFWHANIIRHVGRPFGSVEEMNETIIRKWNKVVPKDGIVFHLGDVCMCNEDKLAIILSRLKGTIFLALGNHDKWMIGRSILNHFAGVDFEMQIKVGGQDIILNHFPFLIHGGRHTQAWQLFRHIHTSPRGSVILSEKRIRMLSPNQYDVGVDNNGFAPVSFEKVRQIIQWQRKTGKRF